ncbi:hypothetical protein D3C73_538220 [compost metagenome]
MSAPTSDGGVSGSALGVAGDATGVGASGTAGWLKFLIASIKRSAGGIGSPARAASSICARRSWLRCNSANNGAVGCSTPVDKPS